MFDSQTWFHKKASAYVEAQILFHLNQCGIFNILSRDKPIGIDKISHSLNLDKRILSILLDYIHQVDVIIEKTTDGKFILSDKGHAVLSRYGRKDEDGFQYNLFDVRVGAFGPVWKSLGELLRKESKYGIDIKRDGQYAEEGLYKLSTAFLFKKAS